MKCLEKEGLLQLIFGFMAVFFYVHWNACVLWLET
jgi:hypothetical protein